MLVTAHDEQLVVVQVLIERLFIECVAEAGGGIGLA